MPDLTQTAVIFLTVSGSVLVVIFLFVAARASKQGRWTRIRVGLFAGRNGDDGNRGIGIFVDRRDDERDTVRPESAQSWKPIKGGTMGKPDSPPGQDKKHPPETGGGDAVSFAMTPEAFAEQGNEFEAFNLTPGTVYAPSASFTASDGGSDMNWGENARPVKDDGTISWYAAWTGLESGRGGSGRTWLRAGDSTNQGDPAQVGPDGAELSWSFPIST